MKRYCTFRFSGAFKTVLSISVSCPSRADGDVGPLGEVAHVKHDVSPGVDAKISGQNSNDVQYEAGFYLNEQSHLDQNSSLNPALGGLKVM